jgi:uncharacterized protein YejL (UPF0352 family)
MNKEQEQFYNSLRDSGKFDDEQLDQIYHDLINYLLEKKEKQNKNCTSLRKRIAEIAAIVLALSVTILLLMWVIPMITAEQIPPCLITLLGILLIIWVCVR